MNEENQTAPVPEPVDPEPVDPEPVDPEGVEASPGAPAGDTPVPAPEGSRPRRRARVLGAAALALVTLAGVTVTAVVVGGADREAGKPVWKLPRAVKEKAAPEPGGLRGMLLPYGETYGRGPDMDEFGSDVELSGRQAEELRKQPYQDLPRSERRLIEKQYEKDPLKGMAMRTYVGGADPEGGDSVFTVQVVLTQRAHPGSSRSVAALREGLKFLRKGPGLKGHERDAACFLPPAGLHEDIDSMLCFGHIGDVDVAAWAHGAAPLDRKAAAEMIRAQFDRIKDPGEAV
ncbi:hypothetical protein IF655_21830 [Streptomyces sp. DSM 110735]|uniref:hypothetical protein n=1 Tax=Streptomyces sp. DSM 110735 TaxID=2775031 RepID=UPI0018F53FF7|nr:hypothetical protein [Streptomyces sp. DSM 110735]MBJ7905933.1 hypothetical protein [Streptomyces sp. DSM 110735]